MESVTQKPKKTSSAPLKSGSDLSPSTAERIMSVTLDLLSSRCLHSISIRDIATKAHVNSALISYHFKSKETLYQSIIASQFQIYQQQVVSTFKTDGDTRDNIKNACQAITSFHHANPCWLVLYFRELTNPSHAYETIIKPCIKHASEQCVAMIRAGIVSGVIRPDLNPRHITLAMVGMLNYFFMTRQIMQDLQIEPANNLEDYINFVCSTLLNAVTEVKTALP
jgi:AcrR family transcriptional regulator